jgi:hypothetical protein
LPLFVTGGGAQSKILAEFVAVADRIGSKSWHPTRAFGLSFDAINIGTIEAPADIPDIERNEKFRYWQHVFVDKTQV